MNLLDKVHEYLKQLGYNDDQIANFDASSVGLCMEIAMYAHRGQKRDRNESYFEHPYAVMQNYRNLIKITSAYDCIDVDLIYKHGLVYDGIQELCLLHDVIEDTAVTIDEIREVFDSFGLKSYFLVHIEPVLLLLTHKKDVPYDEYIDGIIKSLSASIVKMMDLTDNMNMLLLNSLDDYCFKRTLKYVNALKKINDVHHIIEKSNAYLEEFNLSRKS